MGHRRVGRRLSFSCMGLVATKLKLKIKIIYMSHDLNFQGHNTRYATHGLHSYAAKCPPQLVEYGLNNYSKPGDLVLDPMVGSGTTLVESRIHGRNAIGFDIDPLACLIAKVKSQILADDEIEASYELLRRKVLKDINNLENGSTSKALANRGEYLNGK